MSTVKTVRDRIEREAMALVEEAREALIELDKARTETVDVRTRAARVIDAARDLAGADLLPNRFTGVVQNYRYGMIDEGLPANDRRPKHRFEVSIKEQGLCLHVAVGSKVFEDFLATTPLKGVFNGADLNGKTITVRRSRELGLTPVGLGVVDEDGDSEVILGKDAQGNDLRKGDMVRLREPSPRGYPDKRSYKARVVDFSNGFWTVQRPDRKSVSRLSNNTLTRDGALFEKL